MLLAEGRALIFNEVYRKSPGKKTRSGASERYDLSHRQRNLPCSYPLLGVRLFYLSRLLRRKIASY